MFQQRQRLHETHPQFLQKFSLLSIFEFLLSRNYLHKKKCSFCIGNETFRDVEVSCVCQKEKCFCVPTLSAKNGALSRVFGKKLSKEQVELKLYNV